MMTMDQHLSTTQVSGADEPFVLASLWSGVGQWLRTCAHYHEAAATYEDLARLSNAELSRRGLRRDTLARDVCSLCDRRE